MWRGTYLETALKVRAGVEARVFDGHLQELQVASQLDETFHCYLMCRSMPTVSIASDVSPKEMENEYLACM